MSVQPNSIMGLDLTTSQGRQALQDVIDQLAGTITKQLTGGSPANPSVIDTLRVKKLYVHEGIDVLPGDKPPAEGLAALVVPFLISRRGRPQVLRYEDQNDGGDLMEWRWQPYALSTPTEDTGDWELAAYSAQRDTAGAFRRLGAIRFGHDGRIRTYTASEILVFDSSALSPLTTKGDLYGHDGSTDVRIAGGSDWKIPTYLASAASGISPQTVDDHLNQLPGAATPNAVLATDGSARSFESLATLLTAEGIDFSTGVTTGRAPVTQEYEATPGTATHSYTPTDPLQPGQTWRVTVWGDATGGTAYIKYPGSGGTTITSNTGTNPFCMVAHIAYASSTSVECQGAFVSDGGSTGLTPTITSTVLNGTIAVSAGTGGTISKWIVERIGDTAAGTAGGTGATEVTALYIPTPTFHYDAQFASGFQTSGSNVTRWDDTAGSLLHAAQGTSTNQPTLGGSGATSHVDFDGTDNYVFFSGTLTGMTSTSGELWAVFELDGLGTDGTIFAVGNSGSSTQYFGLRVNSSNKLEVFENNSGTPDIANGSTTLTTGQVYVVRLKSNASTWTLYLDGTAETLTASSGANNGDWWGDVGTRNRLALGALVRSTVANYFNGKIYEVFGWDSSGKLITDRMATQILAVTRAYWGLS